MKFNLDMAGGACSAGIENARALFEPSKDYSLAEMHGAGLPMESITWMLSKASETHAAALAILSQWAADCVKSQGLRRMRTESARQCALAAAVKAWCKANPERTRKGGKSLGLFQADRNH